VVITSIEIGKNGYHKSIFFELLKVVCNDTYTLLLSRS